MPAAGPRVLLFDIPIALAVGVASWFSAQASRWFDARLENGIDGGPGPWRGGPASWPRGIEAPEVWWWPLPFVVIMVCGLVLRRLYQRVAFALVVLGVGGFLAIGGPYGPCLVAPALVVFSLASSLPVERWVPLVAVLIPMLMAGLWSEPYLGLLDPRAYGVLFLGLGAILLPAMIGLAVRSRRDIERSARAEELRRHAYEERLRVAREVHDVVGHSLSVINLQAGVALHVVDRRPEQVEAALGAIKRTSKEALDELRSTLEVFRDPDLRWAPTAGLSRLDDLVASLRAAGRTVALRDERTRDVPASVDQAAFRIVQESLTNVVRHTEDATVDVVLRTERDALLIVVRNGGPPARPLVEGNGITGMRERARAVGGRLTVDSTGTGLTVRAELPIATGGEG